MKKYLFKISLFILQPFLMHSQQKADSIKSILANANNDSIRFHACGLLYNFYEEVNRDSALYYAEQEYSLARKNNKKLAELISLNQKGYQLMGKGRYAESLQSLLAAFAIAEDKKNSNKADWIFHSIPFTGDNRLYLLSYAHHIFALLMYATENTEQEILHFSEARRISKEIGYTIRQQMADMNLGRSYKKINKLDSALFFENESEELGTKSRFYKYLNQVYSTKGIIYEQLGDKQKAKEYYYKGVQAAIEQKNMNGLSNNYFFLTRFWLNEGEKDSAIVYALKNLDVYHTLGGILGGTSINLGTIYQNIALSYQLNNQRDSAYKYQGLALDMIDSLNKIRIKNLTAFQNTGFNEQLRLQNVEKENIAYQNKVRTILMLGGIGILFLLAIIFYRNNRRKHRDKIKIEKAYDDLKATQQQLVQSEKMASLGELTAGIAHEIQNPLNFVNNFSELNAELVEELKAELATGNMQMVNEIAGNIKENEEKINHHGKRADAIVKSMLQHSRTSSGKKELTDVNVLLDEYLRLAYHGLRAKDKNFNASFTSDFDTSIEPINIIPQDIGRVILNLINNAFYAVNEKRDQHLNGYEPKVRVTSKKLNDKIEVKVIDNGNGIPEKVREKIFQPFFTTKPTGEGTGLGLSLSYDIITKGHGGKLDVKTKEGEFTEFIIQLPVKS